MDPIGAIGTYWADPHEATEHELALLQALADATAIAMESVKLWQELESRVDARTAELEEASASVEKLLREATERGEDLQAAVEHQRNLLNSLAHEVKSPLTASSLMLDELLEDYGLDGEAAENVRDAHRCIDEAVRIVDDQLQRAKLEAGVLRPRLEPVAITELYLALRGMVRALRRTDAVQLVFDAPPGLPRLRTDPQMLGQILRNLIGNALKFTEEGIVTVAARWDPGDDSFRFTVSDTGIGINAEDRDRIFEDFGQVVGVQGPGRSGTGLGLPLSRSLANSLGGTLELVKGNGHGATFVLRLPYRP
jgi:signal transduction histidine kinase